MHNNTVCAFVSDVLSCLLHVPALQLLMFCLVECSILVILILFVQVKSDTSALRLVPCFDTGHILILQT